MENNSIINCVQNQIEKMNDFSGVVKIKNGENVIFEEAYGYADIANERKNNISTRFGIASGAKLFTALAICKLVDNGMLKFDSLLKDYLDFDNFDDDVTIKHLVTHTSGLPDYFDEEEISDFSELWIDNPMYLMKEPKDFIYLMKNLKTMFKCGEKFHYNNGAFVILAYIVEKISGMSFTDYVQTNILDVLNMNSSGYFSMDMLPKNCAFGYEKNDEGKLKTNIYSIPIIGGGDGGVFTTAEDIDKLWDGLFTNKLFSKEIKNELLTPCVHVNYDVYYGYGIWMVKKEDNIFKYYITGSDPGVSFTSVVYSKEDITVTILGNKEFSTYEIINEIEKTL